MIHWNRRTYTKEEFIDSWNTSRSIAECLRKLDLTIYGSSYSTAKQTAEELGLTRDHMLGQASNRGSNRKGGVKPKPLDELLVVGSSIGSSHLRIRLVKEGVFEEICATCGLREWMGKPIPLELDHIDGDNVNNTLVNLRLLCSNCHAQTETYCVGKGRRKKYNYPNRVDNKCADCGTGVGSKSTRCRKCAAIYRVAHPTDSVRRASDNLCACGRVISYGAEICRPCYKTKQASRVPAKEELVIKIRDSGVNLEEVGRLYGVNGNSIRKWLKKYGLPARTKELREMIANGILA